MNTAIALGVKPIDIPDPAAGYQRALTLQALMGQNDLQGLQMQEAQRTLRMNQAQDEAAQGSSSTADYLMRLSKINPGAAIKLQNELLATQKTQGEVGKQQTDTEAQLAGAFLSLPPEQRASQYPAFVQQWKNLKLTNWDKLEAEQYDPAFEPHLQQIAARGLTPEQGQTRADYASASAMPPQSPTVAALTTPQAQPPVSPSVAATPAGAPNVANMSADQETAAWQKPVSLSAPTQEVTAKKTGMTPDEMRLRGDFAANKGTAAGNKIAAEWYTKANQMEERAQADEKIRMDRFTSPAGAPGVTFNKTTGEYFLNGKLISADKVQEIANQQARAGATVVTQNAGPKAFYGDYGKNMAEQLGSEQKSAQKAADTITTINKMRGELDSGMYTGGFAERRLGVVNLLNGLGIHIDEKTLANTQAFKSFVGSQLLQHAKDLGTNPSNADAIRIDKIVGNIENDPNALQKIMDFNEEMGRRSIDRFNSHYQEVKKDPNAQFGFDMSVTQPEKYQPQRRATDRNIDVKSLKPDASVQGTPLTATNPKTGQKIVSKDGGKTWQAP